MVTIVLAERRGPRPNPGFLAGLCDLGISIRFLNDAVGKECLLIKCDKLSRHKFSFNFQTDSGIEDE